jgi:hypothetical protein
LYIKDRKEKQRPPIPPTEGALSKCQIQLLWGLLQGHIYFPTTCYGEGWGIIALVHPNARVGSSFVLLTGFQTNLGDKFVS